MDMPRRSDVLIVPRMSDANFDFAPKPIRPLLTAGELLRIVPVSNSTLDWLIKTGQLPVIRIKNLRFFAPDDVERFLRSCSGEGPGAGARR